MLWVFFCESAAADEESRWVIIMRTGSFVPMSIGTQDDNVIIS